MDLGLSRVVGVDGDLLRYWVRLLAITDLVSQDGGVSDV